MKRIPLFNQLLMGAISLLLFSSPLLVFGQSDSFRLDSIYYYEHISRIDSVLQSRTICEFGSFASSENCYDYSSCISSSFDSQTRIWKPQSKIDLRTEDKNGKQSSINFTWEEVEERWIPEEKRLVSQGELEEKTERFRWDEDARTWTMVFYNLYQKNLIEQLEIWENQNYNEDMQRWEGHKQVRGLTESGNRSFEEHYEWDSSKSLWAPQSRQAFAYNEQGLLSLQEDYRWVSSEETWKLSRQTEKTYDQNGNLLQISSIIPGFSSLSLEEFLYNDDNQIILRIASSQQGLDGLVPNNKTEYTFNPEGHLVEVIYSQWHPDQGIWVIHQTENRDYNAQGRVILIEERERDLNLDTLLFDRRQTFAYDATGLLVEETSLYPRFGSNSELAGQRNTYLYDDQRRRFRRETAKWDLGLEDWVNDRASENPYDEQDRVLCYSSYNWDKMSNKWEGTLKIGFSYDDSGNIVRFYRAFWSPRTETWFTSSSQVSSWGPCSNGALFSDQLKELTVYPNPLQQNLLFVSSNLEGDMGYEYSILSLTGEELLKFQGNNHARLDLSELSDGVYLVQVKAIGSDRQIIRKLVVRR